VVNRASKIKGTERVRDWDVLAGESTETVHREYGYEFELDIAEVYFSPRLATERHRVVEQVTPGEHAFDMFAGVGPYAVPIAAAGAEIVATDINERAIHYLRRNAERNGVADRVTAIAGDVRVVAGDYENWADRVVMNLPTRPTSSSTPPSRSRATTACSTSTTSSTRTTRTAPQRTPSARPPNRRTT